MLLDDLLAAATTNAANHVTAAPANMQAGGALGIFATMMNKHANDYRNNS